MSEVFKKLVEAQQELGRRNYARWNDRLYQQICAGPAKFLWEKTGQDVSTMEAYVTAISEGIGRGYVQQSADPRYHEFFRKQFKWTSLLEFWLVLAAPLELPGLKPGERVPLLGKLWNLGENILRDKPWIGPYVLKRSIESQHSLLTVERQLTEWISPVLQLPSAARWQPPFEVQVIDGREIRDNFIPGEMHFSAPNLACVKDRRFQDVVGGIFLHEPEPTVISHHSNLGNHKTDAPAVSIENNSDGIVLNGHNVLIPRLGRSHSQLIFAGGTVLLTAVDSQRIWLIKST